MNDMNTLSLAAGRVLGLRFRLPVRSVTLTAILLGLAACGGGGGGGDGGGISTGDANDLMENISAKVGGTTLVLQPGDLPAPTPVEAAPKAIAGVTSVTAEPGDTVNIPISVQSSAVLQSLCAKIGNATSTLCASLASSASSLSAPTQNQKRIARAVQAKQLPSQFSEALNLSITLPGELNPDGTFCVNLNVQDVEDLVSNNVQVCITAVANIVEPSPSENDQPSANALPAVLADGEWISPCVDLPSGGDSESSKLGFRFGLSGSYEEFIELWNSSNNCSGTPDSVLQHVVQGSYASGTAEFNRQLQKWQLPFDFIPEQTSGFVLGTCFNVLRVAGEQLYLGVPLAAVAPGQPNDPGSCVSAQTRPESISLAFPFGNRESTAPAENAPPVASAGSTLNITTQQGQTVALDGTNSADADGTIVGFAWTQTGGTPTVTLISANSAQPQFSAPAAPASLTFALTVTDDDGATDTASVTVNFLEAPNVLPVAEAGPNATDLTAGTLYALDGRESSDADGTIISYAWEQISGPVVTLQNADTARPSFTVPTGPDMLTFRLTVTDNRGGADTDEVTLTIAGPVVQENQPPTANAALGEGTFTQNAVPAGTQLFLDGSGSSDADGQITGYSWTRIAGPEVDLSNASTSKPSFLVPEGSGELVFRLTVVDDAGATDEDEIALSFSTGQGSSPGLTFTTTWDTSAEIDLYVTDPFQGVISWEDSTSDFGQIQNSTGIPMGPEIITFPSPPPGNYCYEIRYYVPTGDFGTTNFTVTISFDGDVVEQVSGTLSIGGSQTIACYAVIAR